MYKISIVFLDREFEHDIYELIRAFYPECEIDISGETAEKCDLCFRIEKQDQSCLIYYRNEQKHGVISAEFIQGQSSDALLSCTEDAHALRKENKDRVKYALYQLLVKLTGRNPSRQAGYGNDRVRNEKYRSCTGDAGAISGKSPENRSCRNNREP